MFITSNEQLIAFISNGGCPKYLYFLGHQKSKTAVTKSCFSQWYDSPFKENGLTFKTAEHYMMYHKAKLFADEKIATQILTSNHPNEAKKLGRKVKNFDENQWNKNRFDIVVNANKLKFAAHSQLLDFLLSTSDRVLVEASPVDTIWGIGLAVDDPRAAEPKQWRGLNLLGYALMTVRELARKLK